MGLRGGLQCLACWTANREDRGSNPGQGRNLVRDFCSTCAPKVNSAMMSTLTSPCQWEDKTVRERTGHPPSCTEAKKMKSLTLHTHGCPKASLCVCTHVCARVSFVIKAERSTILNL